MAAVQHQYIADNMSRLLGVMIFGLGLAAQIDPVAGAKTFAGATAVRNERDALFFPIVGGRNMAIGLSVLALSWQGERKAVATIMLCTGVAGVVDVVFCLRNKSEKWSGHAIGSAIGIPLSWWLLQ